MEELEIKDKILKGAEELFMRYGVRSISMDDIARHLSVSKKTLYQYFADKDELVTMVSAAHIERNAKQFDELREQSSNPIEELAKLSVCLKRDMENINPALLYDLNKFHPKAWSVWLNHKNKFIRESVIRNLMEGIEGGYFRPSINPAILAAVRIELVQLAFNNEVFPQSEFSIAVVQEQLFDHYVYGLVTDKGRKLYEKYKNMNPQPNSVL
jgi:AcrR family transcriptional regulator